MANDVMAGDNITVKNDTLYSVFLKREVLLDFYFPDSLQTSHNPGLLLINDGQDLPVMPFTSILSDLHQNYSLKPLVCVGIHCGTDRKNEYGTAKRLNYRGQGAKATEYTKFILHELLPYTRKAYNLTFTDKSFAGFSLGGLSALDIVLNHPDEFVNAAAFSGSFWWRSRAYGREYNDDTDRIMHSIIRELPCYEQLSFFFECGALDELADRNNNGIIDSIDDTRDIIQELRKKGYDDAAIKYVELPDGMHNVATWAKAFPEYLLWRWGR